MRGVLFQDFGAVELAVVEDEEDRAAGIGEYSLELNPDEWVWKNVKHDNLGRAAAKSTGDLAEFARIALNRLKAAPQIVQAFFRDPALTYIGGHSA